jgi:poly(3-hydroxybutyrate) depolymerase
MLYQAYEFQRLLAHPVRLWANALEEVYTSPYNPWSDTWFGKSVAAGAEIVSRLTANYGKPAFGLQTTRVGDETVAVNEEILLRKPFCQLLRFRATPPRDPKVLLVAPMSGHYATLLRGTVEALLPDHDVHITDWDRRPRGAADGGQLRSRRLHRLRHRVLPLSRPRRARDRRLPAVGAGDGRRLADGAAKDPRQPRSLTLMGGPIDTRISPTVPNDLAMRNSMMWFRQNVISTVPFNLSGALRRVYPGFLQLTSFISMNLDRHVNAHMRQFEHLIKGDDDQRRRPPPLLRRISRGDGPHRRVLPPDHPGRVQGAPAAARRWVSRGRKIDPSAIETALMTVEGELDDISGIGQTKAAHALTPNIPGARHVHWEQPRVGHYGIFNGRKWREQIMPRVRDFIRANDALNRPGFQALCCARSAETVLGDIRCFLYSNRGTTIQSFTRRGLLAD